MPIFSIIFLLLLTVPVLEIFLLIQVGSVIGAWNTILFVFATAFLGAYLLRKQGMSTIARAQAAMGRKEIPAVEMLEGVMLVFTGTLLLTPGFFTDAIGFICLIPVVRQLLAKRLIRHFTLMQAGGTTTSQHRPGSKPQSDKSSDQTTIEGEFWRDEDK